jgi:hypothetical protein
MNVISVVLIVLFMFVQGAAVFATAKYGLRLMRTSSRLAKVAAMAISYVGWLAFTIAGYVLIGGEGGLMDGSGLLLFLGLTALISSILYGLVWLFWPQSRAAKE